MILNGEEVLIIYDGNKEMLIKVNDELEQMNTEERMWNYIDKAYWYLPKLDRRKVALNHGISMVDIINNYVIFESMTPNRNYYNQIQMCRKRFNTSIMICNNDGFLFMSKDDVDEILKEQKK